MALPMMNTPTFNLVVPSTGVSVKFRPFLIKEEKALLIAQQSEDPVVMVDTLKNIIKDCTIDKIDTDKLATFDLEYMFTQIRAKSVGENVDLFFPCDIDHGEDNEKARVKITLDLSQLKVIVPEGHDSKISLFADVGVKLRYPTLDIIKKLESLDTDNLEILFQIVASSIDYIYQGDEIYYAKEQRNEELLQFLNNLTSEQFLKIQKFFETMPRIKHDVEYTCPVCNKHHQKTLEGLHSFF